MHRTVGPISPEQILEKHKYHDFIYKIFHVENVSFKADVPNENDPDDQVPYLNVTTIPVLFGIKLHRLKMEVNITFCPPGAMLYSSIPFLNMSCYMLVTYIPTGPVESTMFNHIYHEPNFKSKLFARIYFFLVHSMVSIINVPVYVNCFMSENFELSDQNFTKQA